MKTVREDPDGLTWPCAACGAALMPMTLPSGNVVNWCPGCSVVSL